MSFDAAYTGLSNATFTVKGIGLSRNRTWAGLGILTEFNPNFAWYANYDGKFEKGKLNNNVFTTGVRINIDQLLMFLVFDVFKGSLSRVVVKKIR